MRPVEGSPLKLSGQILNLITFVFGIAAAYFLTIQSLKIELADKAENAAVSALDKKLAHLEVIIREGVITKEQFYEFSKDIDERLTRIEYHLMQNTGDQVGKK